MIGTASSECIKWMMLRESDRARILRQVAQPQALTFPENYREQAMADRRRSDQCSLLGRDPGGEEGFDATHRRRHRESTVARPDELAGMVNDFLEHQLEAQLARDVQARPVQSEQLAVLLLDTILHVFDAPEDGL
jgi:hypothetical protein